MVLREGVTLTGQYRKKEKQTDIYPHSPPYNPCGERRTASRSQEKTGLSHHSLHPAVDHQEAQERKKTPYANPASLTALRPTSSHHDDSQHYHPSKQERPDKNTIHVTWVPHLLALQHRQKLPDAEKSPTQWKGLYVPYLRVTICHSSAKRALFVPKDTAIQIS